MLLPPCSRLESSCFTSSRLVSLWFPSHGPVQIFDLQKKIALTETGNNNGQWWRWRALGHGQWVMSNGRWARANGQWLTGNSRWAMAGGQWQMGNGRGAMAMDNGKCNWQQLWQATLPLSHIKIGSHSERNFFWQKMSNGQRQQLMLLSTKIIWWKLFCSRSHVPVQMLPMASEKFALTASGNSDGWLQLTMMTIEVDRWAMVVSQSWISIENSTWLRYIANFQGNITFVRIPNWHHGNNKDFYNSDANLVNFKGNSFESTKLTPCA